MKTIKLLLTAVVALFATSCCVTTRSTECAKKRINKIVSKHPELINDTIEIEHDTLFQFDTIYHDEIHLDTVFRVSLDTVLILSEGRVKTEIEFITRDVFKVNTIVQADTITLRDTIINERIKEVRIVDTTKEVKKRIWNSPLWFGMWVVVMLFVVFLVAQTAIKKYFS